jgi:chromosome segregation ATPase
VGRSDAEAKLTAAQTRRREAEEQLRQQEERLGELEEERESLIGSTALARQALADLSEYEKRLEQELASLRLEELRVEFAQAVRARDGALERASLAVAELAEALDRVDNARAELLKSHRRLAEAGSGPSPAIPPEPTRFRDRWSAIAPLVEQELGRRLDYELVEAAARSSNRLAFQELPEHLRELAVQRRREVMQAANKRTP